MSTSVSVRTYTHSVTYVTENILKSLKDIIRLSGLSPEKLASSWESTHRAIKTWIESGHLEKIVLEVYNPADSTLIARWDIEISYEWSDGDGGFWTDTEQLKFAIKKAGVWPSSATYDVKVENKPGRPDVPGWGPCSMRSTDGFVKQSLGATVEHGGLGAGASYYRRQ